MHKWTDMPMYVWMGMLIRVRIYELVSE